MVLEQSVRFIVEVAKDFTMGRVKFYDPHEWETIFKAHGPVSDILKRTMPK